MLFQWAAAACIAPCHASPCPGSPTPCPSREWMEGMDRPSSFEARLARSGDSRVGCLGCVSLVGSSARPSRLRSMSENRMPVLAAVAAAARPARARLWIGATASSQRASSKAAAHRRPARRRGSAQGLGVETSTASGFATAVALSRGRKRLPFPSRRSDRIKCNRRQYNSDVYNSVV